VRQNGNFTRDLRIKLCLLSYYCYFVCYVYLFIFLAFTALACILVYVAMHHFGCYLFFSPALCVLFVFVFLHVSLVFPYFPCFSSSVFFCFSSGFFCSSVLCLLGFSPPSVIFFSPSLSAQPLAFCLFPPCEVAFCPAFIRPEVDRRCNDRQ